MEAATVVLYPSPGIGHLISMVELGKLMIANHPNKSLSILILITPPPSETVGSTANYINTVSATLPFITFHHFPTVPPPPEFSTLSYVDLSFNIPKLYNPAVHDTLVAISEKSTIKAVVLDFFTNAAFEVSTSLNIPTYYFHSDGASGLCVFLYLPTIHNTTSLSIKDLEGNLEVPGTPPIHPSDIPSAMSDRNIGTYNNFLSTAINMGKSSGIMANSFKAFEERAVDAISDGKCIPDGPTPPVYLIGPLIASGGRLDPDENECLKWLNSQPSKSVVFLSFGSMGLFKKEQLKEMAIGLEKSGQRFLWVVRNPPSDDKNRRSDLDLEALLPEGFLERTKDKGLVVKNWAPQVDILSHDSVGGFVSHCGWNSTLEAVVAGVPIIAWPLYAEQKMNRVFLVKEMKVALAVNMRADGFVTAGELEKRVRELMEGEGGRVVRDRVLEMSKSAKSAVEVGGSSRMDFSKVTESLTVDS